MTRLHRVTATVKHLDTKVIALVDKVSDIGDKWLTKGKIYDMVEVTSTKHGVYTAITDDTGVGMNFKYVKDLFEYI